jgi:hypothetical protein
MYARILLLKEQIAVSAAVAASMGTDIRGCGLFVKKVLPNSFL